MNTLESPRAEKGSYLCSSLFVSCCSIDLTSQKKPLGAFHLQSRAQLSGTHKVILHTVTWKKNWKMFHCLNPIICRVIKQDIKGVPGVWISALCMAGISLMRRSCISGGMVMERPWGYKRSDSNPSGSSHTWCCRPGKRSTRDSMEGQYLEKMRIFFEFQKTLGTIPGIKCVCVYLGPLVSCFIWQLRWRLSLTTLSTPGVVYVRWHGSCSSGCKK